MNYLFLDIEAGSNSDTINEVCFGRYRKISQISWLIFRREQPTLIKCCGYQNKDISEDITEISNSDEEPLISNYCMSKDAFLELKKDINESDLIISHNLENDLNNIIRYAYHEYGASLNFDDKAKLCTMKDERIIKFCQSFEEYGTDKWPKLEELHQLLFAEDKIQKHNSLSDVIMCEQCFFELKKRGIIGSVENLS